MRKIYIKMAVAAAFVLGLAGTVSATNIIVNGSFEDPNLGGTWSLFNSIPGWNAAGDYPIEIGAGSIYGVTGYDGQQVMEMDSTGNAIVDQIVASPGGNYTLSLLYALRADVAPESGTFDVYWNGNLVQSFSPTSNAMSLYSTTVTASAFNTLSLVGTGIQDSYGAIVDDVQLNCVPDGGMTIMLLGGALVGLGAIRRKLFN